MTVDGALLCQKTNLSSYFGFFFFKFDHRYFDFYFFALGTSLKLIVFSISSFDIVLARN
jgi:hypothetical protein